MSKELYYLAYSPQYGEFLLINEKEETFNVNLCRESFNGFVGIKNPTPGISGMIFELQRKLNIEISLWPINRDKAENWGNHQAVDFVTALRNIESKNLLGYSPSKGYYSINDIRFNAVVVESCTFYGDHDSTILIAVKTKNKVQVFAVNFYQHKNRTLFVRLLVEKKGVLNNVLLETLTDFVNKQIVPSNDYPREKNHILWLLGINNGKPVEERAKALSNKRFKVGEMFIDFVCRPTDNISGTHISVHTKEDTYFGYEEYKATFIASGDLLFSNPETNKKVTETVRKLLCYND